MIDRSGHLNRIAGLLKRFPIVAILGARHIAKTTLVTQIIRTYRGVSLCFDLEDPTDIAAGGSDAGATGADWTHRAGRNPAPPESVSSSVAHRALPLIKMLKTALAQGEHVIWER